MSEVFTIEVLPAQRGDALWIEYGDSQSPRHILIDGGITSTGRGQVRSCVEALGADGHIDLLVVTHIDLDHIQGIIALLRELPVETKIDRVWFNGRDHLPPVELQAQGPIQGLELMELLSKSHAQAWNCDAGGAAIALDANGRPRAFDLPDGMVVTVLSPDEAKLISLRDEWDDVVEAFGAEQADIEEEDEGMTPAIPGLEPLGGAEDIDIKALADAKFSEDKTAPNGSSIAVLLEFAHRRALMLADAHPSLVLKGLRSLSAQGPLTVDCVKLAHHGSRNNTSKELIQHLRSPRWVFSSNGAQTRHPNREAVARVLKYGGTPATLIFNYRTGFNDCWDDQGLKDDYSFTTLYGDGTKGTIVDLMQDVTPGV